MHLVDVAEAKMVWSMPPGALPVVVPMFWAHTTLITSYSGEEAPPLGWNW